MGQTLEAEQVEVKTYYYSHGRWFVNCHRTDPVMTLIKRIEGRRWHPAQKAWSVPASLRAARQLDALGFTLLKFGGGQDLIANLMAGVENTTPIPADQMPEAWDFQLQDVAWMMQRPFVLNANEQGTGKTREAVTTLVLEGHERIIVVAPKVTFGGWKRTISAASPRPITVRKPDFPHDRGWLLVNYEYAHLVKPTGSYALVVDEAHYISNPKARRTRSVLRLGAGASRIIALTGTPQRGKQVVKLWPLFLLLRQRDEKEFFPWALRYCAAFQHDFGWDFTGASHLDELRDELNSFMLRREKSVLKGLPEKLQSTVVVEADRTTQRHIDTFDDRIFDYLAQGHMVIRGLSLSGVQELRMWAATLKVPAVIEWALAHGVPDNKLIIFGEFLEPLHAIAEGIRKGCDMPIKVLMMTGAETDKESIEKEFWENPEAGVVCCTYGAAGVGVNLQCASTVLLVDLPYTPDTFDQAADRAHRAGQKNNVHVVSFVTTSRVEALMLEGLRAARSVTETLLKRASSE